jgi:hypothetical protein
MLSDLEFYHLMFRGDRCEELFYFQKDFYSGLNSLALSAYDHDVRVLAFCFLDNHGHIIYCSAEGEHKRFVLSFRISIAMNLNRLHNFHGVFGGDEAKDLILVDEEDLKDAICYCLRNPRHHGVETDFWRYSYSSVRLYYKQYAPIPDGSLLDNARASSFLPSHRSLPPDYRMSKSGLILPQSYVDTEVVETLFGNKAQFKAMLSRQTERELRGEEESSSPGLGSSRTTMTDPELIASIEDYISLNDSASQSKRIFQLTIKEKYEAIRFISKNNVNCTAAQLARVLDLPYTTVCYRKNKA